MRKLKLYQGLIKVLFASTILMTLSGCKKEEKETRQENLVGYIDLNPDDVNSSDFICYNVGNYKHIGISNQNQILNKCEEKDISVGIIIDSDASTRIDIFEDVEFTKSIIENNKIDLPVYLNIEKILENDNLNMDEKCILINEFIKLLEKNNIYVGLYGTSTSLSLLNNNGFRISEKYDCFVKEDGKVEYNGLSSIRQDLEGNIKSTYQSVENNNNLANLIHKKNLNNPNNLKQNGFYIVEDANDIEQISIKYGLSINDILTFNKIKKENLKPGVILRIPNQIQDKKELVFPILTKEEKAIYRGIDISCYQKLKKSQTFKDISKEIDFAILKIGEQQNNNFETLREDPKFEEFYNECTKNQISVGGYYVTRATTVKEAVEEAKLIVDRIKNLNITFPIYIDYENTNEYAKDFKKIKENKNLKELLESVNEVFDEAGFRFGIYTNLSTYSEMENIIGLKTLNKYEIWLSKPNEYTQVVQVLDYGPRCKSDDNKYVFACDMNQVSWKISDLGIGNDEGYVDYNLCYVDYKAPKQQIELPPEKIFETKQYKRLDAKKIISTTSRLSIGTISGTCLILYAIGHRKKWIKKIKKIYKKMYVNSEEQKQKKLIQHIKHNY